MKAKKLLALVLSLVLIVGLFPATVLAADVPASGDAKLVVSSSTQNLGDGTAFAQAPVVAKAQNTDTAEITLTNANTADVTFVDPENTSTVVLKNLTIDLNTYTLTLANSTVVVPKGATLKIKNGTLAAGNYSITNNGTLELEDVVITSNTPTTPLLNNASGATLTVTGTKSVIPVSSGGSQPSLSNKGTANIGTKAAPISSFGTIAKAVNDTGATLNLYAANVTASGALIDNSGTANITVTNTLKSAAASTNAANQELTISAATIDSTGGTFLTNEGVADVTWTGTMTGTVGTAFTNNAGTLTVKGKNLALTGVAAIANATNATAAIELSGKLTSKAMNTNAISGSLTISAEEIDSTDGPFLQNSGTANITWTEGLAATAAFDNNAGTLTASGKDLIDGGVALDNATGATATLTLTGTLATNGALVNATRGNLTVSAKDINATSDSTDNSKVGEKAFLDNSGTASVTFTTSLAATKAFNNQAGTLTVTGGTGTLTEKAENLANTSTNAAGAVMTIESGTYNASAGELLSNAGTLNINGGKFSAAAAKNVITTNGASAELNIKTATIEAATTGAAVVNTSGTTTITAGTYTSVGGDVITAAAGEVNLNGGTYTATAAGKSAVSTSDDSKLVLNIAKDAKLEAKAADGFALNSGNTETTSEVNITGSTLLNSSGAAINNMAGAKFTIDGGTFTSKAGAGGSVLMAGGAATSLVIKNGTFTYGSDATFVETALASPANSSVSGGSFSTKIDADGVAGAKALTIAAGKYCRYADGVYVVDSTMPSTDVSIKNFTVKGAAKEVTIPAAAAQAADANEAITVYYSASDFASNQLTLTFKTEQASAVYVAIGTDGAAAAGTDDGLFVDLDTAYAANAATVVLGNSTEDDEENVTAPNDPVIVDGNDNPVYVFDGDGNTNANRLFIKVVPEAGSNIATCGYYQIKFVKSSSDVKLTKVAGYDLATEYTAAGNAGTPTANTPYVKASTYVNGAGTVAALSTIQKWDVSTYTEATVYVPSTVKSLSAADFETDGATLTFYGTDKNYATVADGAVTLDAAKDNKLYMKLASTDGTVTKQIVVTVIVANAPAAVSLLRNGSQSVEITGAGAATPAAALQNAYTLGFLVGNQDDMNLKLSTNNAGSIRLLVAGKNDSVTAGQISVVDALSALKIDADADGDDAAGEADYFAIENGVFDIGSAFPYDGAGANTFTGFFPAAVNSVLYIQVNPVVGDAVYYAVRFAPGEASGDATLSYLQVGKGTEALVDAENSVDKTTGGDGLSDDTAFTYSVTVPYASGAGDLYIAVASDYAEVIARDGEAANYDGGTTLTEAGETNEESHEVLLPYNYGTKNPVYIQVTAQDSTVRIYKINITVATPKTTADIESITVNGVEADLTNMQKFLFNGAYTGQNVATVRTGLTPTETTQVAATVKIPIIATTANNLKIAIKTKDNATVNVDADSMFIGAESTSPWTFDTRPTYNENDGAYEVTGGFNFSTYDATAAANRPVVIIQVKSESGGTTNYYRLDVRLDMSSEAKLETVFGKAPTVTETGFNGKTCANAIPEKIQITGKTSLTKADLAISEKAAVFFGTAKSETITTTSPVGLASGENLIYVLVKAEDGTKQYYALTVELVDQIVSYEAALGTLTNGTATLSGTTGIEEGTVVTVTPTANQGYEVKEVTIACEDAEVTAPTAKTEDEGATYTFAMPASNVTVTVTFEKNPGTKADLTTATVTLTPAKAEVGTLSELPRVTVQADGKEVSAEAYDVAWPTGFDIKTAEAGKYTVTVIAKTGSVAAEGSTTAEFELTPVVASTEATVEKSSEGGVTTATVSDIPDGAEKVAVDATSTGGSDTEANVTVSAEAAAKLAEGDADLAVSSDVGDVTLPNSAISGDAAVALNVKKDDTTTEKAKQAAAADPEVAAEVADKVAGDSYEVTATGTKAMDAGDYITLSFAVAKEPLSILAISADGSVEIITKTANTNGNYFTYASGKVTIYTKHLTVFVMLNADTSGLPKFAAGTALDEKTGEITINLENADVAGYYVVVNYSSSLTDGVNAVLSSRLPISSAESTLTLGTAISGDPNVVELYIVNELVNPGNAKAVDGATIDDGWMDLLAAAN